MILLNVFSLNSRYRIMRGFSAVTLIRLPIATSNGMYSRAQGPIWINESR